MYIKSPRQSVSLDAIGQDEYGDPLPDSAYTWSNETFAVATLSETSDAPAVTVTPSAIEEGQTVTVQIDIEDPDDTTHLVWVDWVDGTRTERVVTDDDGGSTTRTLTPRDR